MASCLGLGAADGCRVFMDTAVGVAVGLLLALYLIKARD